MALRSLWMLAACFFFMLMALFAKICTGHFSAWEVVFYRSLVGLVFMTAVMVRKKVAFGTRYPLSHLKRCAAGTLCFALEVLALKLLPLGLAQSISYSSALIFIVFFIVSSRARRRPVEGPLVAVTAAGFGGVLLIARPGASGFDPAGVALGLGAAFCGACVSWSLRELATHKESRERTVFYFMLAGVLAGFAATAVSSEGFHAVTLQHLAPLLGVGVSAVIAQIAMTYAWTYGHPILNSIYDFSGILFATLAGILFFGESPDLFSMAGMAVVFASGAAASVMRLLSERRSAGA